MKIKIIVLTGLIAISLSLSFILASSKDNILDIPPSKLLEDLFSTDTVKQREAKENIIKQRKDMINRLVEVASKKEYNIDFSKEMPEEEVRKLYKRLCSQEETIKLLGELRAIEAIDVLVANIEFSNLSGDVISTPHGGFACVSTLINIGGDIVTEKIISYLNETNASKVSDLAIKLYADVLSHTLPSIREELIKEVDGGEPE